MKTYAAKAYTGPVNVRAIAEKMAEAGIQVRAIGTEHVHFTHQQPEGDDSRYGAWAQLAQRLILRHGTAFGIAFGDVTVVRPIRSAFPPAMPLGRPTGG